MSITSGTIIACMGLAALALAACGGYPEIPGEYATSAGGGSDGAGGQGGSLGVQEVEMFWCYEKDGIIPDATIEGTVYGPEHMGLKLDYAYIPNELTISVGQIVRFNSATSTQNMTSGSPPEKDGKFKTPQGLTHCLKFNVAGTYPFWSIDCWPSDPMLGTIYVE